MGDDFIGVVVGGVFLNMMKEDPLSPSVPTTQMKMKIKMQTKMTTMEQKPLLYPSLQFPSPSLLLTQNPLLLDPHPTLTSGLNHASDLDSHGHDSAQKHHGKRNHNQKINLNLLPLLNFHHQGVGIRFDGDGAGEMEVITASKREIEKKGKKETEKKGKRV